MTSVTQSFPGILMDENNAHVVLVDVLESDPTHVLLTIATAVERKPLAHIKLEPHIALHVGAKLKVSAAKAWASAQVQKLEKLTIEMPKPATSKENQE